MYSQAFFHISLSGNIITSVFALFVEKYMFIWWITPPFYPLKQIIKQFQLWKSPFGINILFKYVYIHTLYIISKKKEIYKKNFVFFIKNFIVK